MESQSNQRVIYRTIDMSAVKHVVVYNAGMVDFEFTKAVGQLEIDTPECAFVKIVDGHWVSFIKSKPTPAKRDKALGVLKDKIMEDPKEFIWIHTRPWEKKVHL